MKYEVYLRNKLAHDIPRFREYMPDNDFIKVIETDNEEVARSYLYLGLSAVHWTYNPQKKLYLLLDTTKVLGYIKIKQNKIVKFFRNIIKWGSMAIVFSSQFVTVIDIMRLLISWTFQENFEPMKKKMVSDLMVAAITHTDDDMNVIERLEYHIEDNDVSAVLVSSDGKTYYNPLYLDNAAYNTLMDLIEYVDT